MIYSFNIYMKDSCKDRIASSLAKIAGIENVREHVNKCRTLVFSSYFPENMKHPLISVKDSGENSYHVKLSRKTMTSLLENL